VIEPKRYKHISDGVESAFKPVDYSEGDAPLGEFVRYEDYARLKAEADDLRVENQAFQRTVNEASAHYDNRLSDISRLKAQVERLTYVGDAMASQLYAFGYDTAWDFWNKAKEGKQS